MSHRSGAGVKLAVLPAGLDDHSDLVECHVATVEEEDRPVPVVPAQHSRAAPLVDAELLNCVHSLG